MLFSWSYNIIWIVHEEMYFRHISILCHSVVHVVYRVNTRCREVFFYTMSGGQFFGLWSRGANFCAFGMISHNIVSILKNNFHSLPQIMSTNWSFNMSLQHVIKLCFKVTLTMYLEVAQCFSGWREARMFFHFGEGEPKFSHISKGYSM